MTQATLARAKAREALSLAAVLTGTQSPVLPDGSSYRKSGWDIKAMMEQARRDNQLAKNPPKIFCPICQKWQDSLSGRYFRAGKEVCWECYEDGHRVRRPGGRG